MKQILIALFICGGLIAAPTVQAADQQQEEKAAKKEEPLSLITKNADEGFQLAIKLARKAVTETQPDREVLFDQREVYSKSADSLISVSHVVAVHFQTIAAANGFWKSAE